MKTYQLIFPFLLFFNCISLPREATDQNFRKNYEGFISDSMFQVHCSQSLYQQPDKLGRRREMIEACKMHMVKMLAEFKVIYDYNKSSFANKNSFLTGGKTYLRRYDIKWTDSQINDLLEFYGNLLPGHVVYEWIEGDKHFFVYSVKKTGLIQIIKNKPLPFAIEYN